jgi:hypothetical protein
VGNAARRKACTKCNGEVPPERIGFDAGLAQGISYWLALEQSLDFLWLDSQDYEEYAQKQLMDPMGRVNRMGIELAGDLSAFRRCYLKWFQGEDNEVPDSCPNCSGALTVKFEGERPQGGPLWVCDVCSIALMD